MRIKNYTSTVPAGKSRMKIQEVLMGLGATQISMEVKDNAVVGMSFAVDLPAGGGRLAYRLPARVDAVERLLAPKRNRRDSKAKDQAERTAWKLLLDWVEVQASLIRIGMTSAQEVFLPYMVSKHGVSLFAELSTRQGGLLALTQPPSHMGIGHMEDGL